MKSDSDFLDFLMGLFDFNCNKPNEEMNKEI